MKNLYLVICILFLSCINNTKVKEELRRLGSVPIKIPTSLVPTFNGIDTLINNDKGSELRFIAYVDSIGCASCVINKMFMWEPYLEYAKQFNGKLKFYFIFHPTDKNINNLHSSMMMNAIDYPILIDENGDFEKMNPHLPKNKAMHTFLLDENNKVILVGNPLYNKEIEKLFYKKTQELLTK